VYIFLKSDVSMTKAVLVPYTVRDQKMSVNLGINILLC